MQSSILTLPLVGALAVVAGVALGVQQSAAVSPVAVEAGALAALPETCRPGALYVATDQRPGEQLQICQHGAWYPAFSVGPSGALALTDGSLDIVPNVVAFKTSANEWTGRQRFRDFQLSSASTSSCVDAQNDLGRVRLDASDPQNTKLFICGVQGGKLQWLSAYLTGANAWQ